MRLSKLLVTTGGIVVFVAALMAGGLFVLSDASDKQVEALSRQAEFKQLGLDLENAANTLTWEAREYAQFGEKVHADNYWREVKETKTRDRVVTRLKELGAPQEELDLIEFAKQNSETLESLQQMAMKAADRKDFDAARSLIFDAEYEAHQQRIARPIAEFQQKMKERTELEVTNAEKAKNTVTVVLRVLGFLMLASVIVAFRLLYLRINKPLASLTKTANRVADGDLTVERIEVRTQDEVADLSEAVNTMVDNLRGLIANVNETAEQVAAMSEELLAGAEQTAMANEQIASTVQEMAGGAEMQVHSAEESLLAMNEMNGGIQRVAETSANVAAASRITAQDAEYGNLTVQKAVGQMDEIARTSQEMSSVIEMLDNRSKEIGQIVEVITGIAAQTNLLALNAAIEAARAGEAGRGFAVVADEVRKLAEQSETSAGQISTLVLEIQRETSAAVEAMASGATEVQAGIQLVDEAGEAFRRIVDAAQEVAAQVEEISSASEEMSAGSEQVTAGVGQLTEIARDSADNAHNVAASTEEQLALMQEISFSMTALSSMAQELQESVGRFRV
ncbi:methyl-accepting chemotaxis protein [Tumebacillus sp. DT12]|uniref:Methyl-accepting chemotaxis protein n=1 Tax=Tumebacillus lacus TaxID=2995335 RepID=A0ABT3WWD9_9BACL|nr:methyl-accepting chemotaxis protein [Tumebacillus lacus]MCX7568994.1 methyl-accepting chemotaxis protein [Tumebacillus lacus]